MPNRFSLDLKIWIYRFLQERDGPNCRICGKAPRKGPFSLEIDHIDNDKTNDDPNNLQLAHDTCNKRKELEFQAKRGKVEVLNVSLEGSPSTRIVKANVDYTMGSAEMKANSFFELKYRQWVISKILTDGSILKKEALNGGAEHVGCSPATIGRYTDKMLSENGPLAEFKDYMNKTVFVLKEDIARVLTSLSKKKPKRKPVKKNKQTTKRVQQPKNNNEGVE